MEVPQFVVEPLWRSYTENRPATRFGRGGFPETDRIRLVKTAADLNRWARRFRNCSRGYLDQMRSGHYLIYVHEPRNVMIGLRRQGRASWHLDQMAGVQNTAISDAVAVEIITWLLEVGVEVPDDVLRRYRP